jgi:hypothetical protein
MVLYSLFIVNKSGSLLFSQELHASVPRMSANEAIRIGSTFHSMHAIAAQISPVAGCRGIESLDTDRFTLHCFLTLTGLKFFVVAELGTPDLPAVLHSVYELYADYVLKDPFYESDQPIRCELFIQALGKLVERCHAAESRGRRDH